MFVGFNQDATNLAVGNAAGFQVFEVPPRASFRRLKKESSLGGISIVALLEGTPLLAVVGSSTASSSSSLDKIMSNRFLQLYDANKNEVLTEMHFDSPVLAVRMNAKRLVAILERHAHLFDLNTMSPLPQIRTDPPNNRGLGSLSMLTSTMTAYFAFPYPEQRDTSRALSMNSSGSPGGGGGGGSSSFTNSDGRVAIIDAIELTQVEVVAAHHRALAAVEFCANGTRFATCSVKGTSVKVFSCPRPKLLFVFRRGQREALVHSLSLSPGGEMVAMTSNTGTLHLFSCADGSQSSSVEGVRSFGKITLPDASYCLCKISDDCRVVNVVTPQAAGQRAVLAQYTVDASPKLINEFPLQ